MFDTIPLLAASFGDLIGDPAVVAAALIAISSGFFVMFIKSVFTIFKFGALFRADYATKEDQRRFEQSVKDDLRNYKEELLKVVMVAAMEMIKEKLSDIDDIKDLATQVKVKEKEIELRIETALDRMGELKGLSDNVKALSRKVETIQFGNTSTGRRKE